LRRGRGKNKVVFRWWELGPKAFENRGALLHGGLRGDLPKRTGIAILLEKCPVDF
jgi:hypothetical protein